MLMKVVVENGVKKLVPLTADAGSGNPCGTIIAVYSNQVPYGYLPCNGVAFDTAQFPVLYALLGDNHTPDLRECTLKGIGESGRTVGAHVKAGGLSLGEFVDDRVQEHTHTFRGQTNSQMYGDAGNTRYADNAFYDFTTGTNSGRSGATTEVKAVGVNFCIKATSGINENQADNVLSALTPVDTVALNNLHSVTSNATFKACSPNYAQAQLIYGGTDEYLDNFTVPENGILIGSGYGNTSSNSFIYFTYYSGGVTARQQGVGSENLSVSMPVRKGDKINIWCYLAINNQGIYFVPYN